MTTETFRVAVDNLSGFRERVDALNRRAERLGIPVATVQYGTRGTHRQSGSFGDSFLVDYVEVTVTCAPVVLDGWRLGAVLTSVVQDDGAVATLVSAVPGVALVRDWAHADAGRCEHCGLVRSRSETFVVVSEDGREVQVGRACLRDFVGDDSAARLAGSAEYISDVVRMLGEARARGLGAGEMSVESWLGWVAESIRREGWVSGAVAREQGRSSTARVAWQMVADAAHSAARGERPAGADEWTVLRDKRPVLLWVPSTAAREEAAAALAWARDRWTRDTARSEFDHNVAVAVNAVAVTERSRGLVAYVVAAFQQATAKVERLDVERGAASVWFGTVGKRMPVAFTVESLRTVESMYGTSVLVIGRTAEGNVVKVFTTSDWAWDVAVGDEVRGKGTVKAHEEYDGRQQTVLARVTVA